MYNIECFQFTSVVMEDVYKWQSHNKYLQMRNKIGNKILKVWIGWVYRLVWSLTIVFSGVDTNTNDDKMSWKRDLGDKARKTLA